jgi:hypothetical protein
MFLKTEEQCRKLNYPHVIKDELINTKLVLMMRKKWKTLQIIRYVHSWLTYWTNYLYINHLTPNGHFSGRTAPLTYRCCIFLFIQQIHVLNILNVLHTLRFFLFKMQFIS